MYLKMSSRGRGKVNFSDYEDRRKADNKESKDKEKIAARSAIIIELFEKIRHERALRHHWISTHVFADAMSKKTKLEKKITAGELQRCLMKHHQLEAHLQKAENNIGIYMHKKKINDLYLRKNGQNYLFLWCCNNGHAPKNNDIDANSFKLG